MNSVVKEFHQQYPAYAKTQVTVKWIPWGNRTTDWNNALSSGKNVPDVTELGNTDTPGEAASGILAPLTSQVGSWSNTSGLVAGDLANDKVNGQTYAVPWFGGVRGVYYRTDQFAKAGITATPTTWSQLLADAQKLMKAYPKTYGLDAVTNDTNAFASFVWGAGGQIATQSGGKWTADLTSAQTEAAIKYYVGLTTTAKVSPAKYVGPDRAGQHRRDLRRRQRGLRPGHAGHVHRRPVGRGDLPQELGRHQEHRLVPDPEPERARPGPGLLRRFRPGRVQDQQEPDVGLGPDLGDGQPGQLHQLRQAVRLLLALLARRSPAAARATRSWPGSPRRP